MRVIELVKNGPPEVAFKINDRTLPPTGSDEVKVKVKAFGINFADVLARLGFYPDTPPLPAVLGYEVVGHVTEVGSNVKDLKPGDKVLAGTRFGGYADEILTQSFAAVKIPDDMRDEEAVALPVNGLTAYHCLNEAVKIRKGDRVLIHAAAGGVGSIAVQLAKYYGAQVYGTCGSDEKIPILKSLGVDYAINYNKQDYVKEIRRLTNGKKLDVILDSLAGPNIPKEMRILRAGGRLVVFGVASIMGARGKNILKLAWVWLRAKRFMAFDLLKASKAVIGVNILRLADQRPELMAAEMKELMELYKKGVFKPLVKHTFKFDQIYEAHRLLESRKSVGKIVVTTD